MSEGSEEHRLRINTAGQAGGVLLMKVTGYLDASNFDRLEKMLEDALDQGQARMIMDIGGLNYINSAGVGVILSAISRSRDAGGDIVLVGPTENVAVVFDLVGMSKFSHIVATLDEAAGILRTHPA